MAKIVLDTNIIVRAVVSPSRLASELLRRTISVRNLLSISNFMLAELDRVLRYPRGRKIHGLSDTEIEDFVRSIQQVVLVVEVDAAKSVRVARDRDDDPVIETAVRAKQITYAVSTKTSVQRMSLTIANHAVWTSSPIQY